MISVAFQSVHASTTTLHTPEACWDYINTQIKKEHIEETLAFVDVDGTLIEFFTPELNHKPAPADLIKEDLKATKITVEQAQNGLSLFRLSRKVQPIGAWPAVLEALQKQKITTYALTQMDTGRCGTISSMEDWRSDELTSLSLTFSQNKLIEDYSASKNQESTNGSSFKKGIAFTGKNSKSQTLEEFWPFLEKFRTIIFVDDRLEQVKDVGAFCARHGINYHGVVFDPPLDKERKPVPEIVRFQANLLLQAEPQWVEYPEAENRYAKMLQSAIENNPQEE